MNSTVEIRSLDGTRRHHGVQRTLLLSAACLAGWGGITGLALSQSKTPSEQGVLQTTAAPQSPANILAQAKSLNTAAIAGRGDFKVAFSLFQQAYNRGSVEAGAWLGGCYMLGHGVPVDLIKGVPLITEAANKDNPVGLRMLALLHTSGKGVPYSPGEAIALYQKAINAGDTASYDPLAMIYLFGNGVPKDPAKALTILKAGADREDERAMLHLGQMYERGDLATGIPKDQAQAADLFRKAAAQGNAIADFRLGKLTIEGQGIPADPGAGFLQVEEAAKAGYAPAQAYLAQLLTAKGDSESLVKAYAWYTVALRYGSGVAMEQMILLKPLLSKEQVDRATLLAQSKDFSGH